MTKRICYVVSDIATNLLIDANVRFLDKARYQLTTVFLGDEVPEILNELDRDGYDVKFIRCRGKLQFPSTTLQLLRLFREMHPEIVHTHYFNASVCGLVAAKLAGIPRRVNTR